MQKYKYLEHTADVLFEAFGKSFEELAENAASAVFETMYEPENVEPAEKVKIEVKGKNKEELLHNYLGELLFEMETREMVFGSAAVKMVEENTMEAVLSGEKLDHEKHGLKTEVKAVTWHEFAVTEDRGKWMAKVLLDI